MKERVKHELQATVNKRQFYEDSALTAAYEKEGIEARVESLTSDANTLKAFKHELQTKLIGDPSSDMVQVCDELLAKYPLLYD